MIQTQLTVTQKETIAPAWWRLRLAGPELIYQLLPGQFLLLLRCGDLFDCYLGRPVFPIQVDDNQIDLLVRPQPDPGLAWLATRKPDDRLDVVGPLGTGFPLAPNIRHLLLVSDDPVIGPLLGQLDRAVAAGLSVTLVMGGSRAATLYPVNKLPPVVEVQLATQDGSIGHRGPVTDLLPELLAWADAVCATGSVQLYRQLKRQVEKVRLQVDSGFLSGLMAGVPLGCGVGACRSCVLTTETGPKLACTDGPVFDLMEIDL